MVKSDKDKSNIRLLCKTEQLIQKHVEKRLAVTVAPVVVLLTMVSGIIIYSFQSSKVLQAKLAVLQVQKQVDDDSKAAKGKIDALATEFAEYTQRLKNDLAKTNSANQNEVRTVVQRAKELNTELKKYENVGDLFNGVEEAKNAAIANLIQSVKNDQSVVFARSVVPVGAVIVWPGKEDSFPGDENWRVCDGSEIEYNEKLASVLQGLYGNANELNSNFKMKLPDFRGQFLRGATSDRAPGSKEDGQVGSHTHPIFGGTQRDPTKQIPKDENVNSHPAWAGSTGSNAYYEIQAAPEGKKHQYGHTFSNNGEETRPDNYSIVWLIRVK